MFIHFYFFFKVCLALCYLYKKQKHGMFSSYKIHVQFMIYIFLIFYEKVNKSSHCHHSYHVFNFSSKIIFFQGHSNFAIHQLTSLYIPYSWPSEKWLSNSKLAHLLRRIGPAFKTQHKCILDFKIKLWEFKKKDELLRKIFFMFFCLIMEKKKINHQPEIWILWKTQKSNKNISLNHLFIFFKILLIIHQTQNKFKIYNCKLPS